MKIVVTKRTSDYHACVDGLPGVWDCGRTQDEAIGALLRTHPEYFDVEINGEHTPAKTGGMSLIECVDALEKHGSDEDPITYKGKSTTPRSLVYELDDHTPAKNVRINYYRGNRWITNGTITGMLADRMKI
jgi:predicted RNase H-like HicB family nuclease